MQVWNEEGRYLKESLELVNEIADEVVVLDNNSKDKTEEEIREILKGKKINYIKEEKNWFVEDWQVGRGRLWNYLRKCDPDYILYLDADEVVEKDRFLKQFNNLIKGQYSYKFPLINFWESKEKYRIDGMWKQEGVFSFIKYSPFLNDKFTDTGRIYEKRIPEGYRDIDRVKAIEDVRVFHYGYAKKEDIERKTKLFKVLSKEDKEFTNRYLNIIRKPLLRKVKEKEKTIVEYYKEE